MKKEMTQIEEKRQESITETEKNILNNTNHEGKLAHARFLKYNYTSWNLRKLKNVNERKWENQTVEE